MSIIKKFNGRVVAIITIIVAMFVLAACGQPSEALVERRDATGFVQEVLGNIVFREPNKVVDNLFLVRDGKNNVVVTWTSSNTSVIAVTENDEGYLGVVERPGNLDGDQKVTLTAVATVEYSYELPDGTTKTNEVSSTKVFEITVLALSAGQTIRPIDVIKGDTVAADDDVAVQGIVTGTFEYNNGGFFVTDATGTIFVFKSFTDTELKLGDEVKVYGQKAFYYGAPQISGDAPSYKVVSSNNEIPAATANTIATVANTDSKSSTLPGNRYTSYALLTLQQDGVNQNYYLTDPYTGEKVQIYYKAYKTDTTDLKNFIDKYVNITYTVYYYDSRISKWSLDYSMMPGSIEEASAPVLTDQQKAELVERDIAKLFGDFTGTSTLTVTAPITSVAYGATITWEALDANSAVKANASDATITWGTVAETAQTTVKATIVVGEYTLVKEYTVTVNPLVPVTVAQFVAAPKGSVMALEGIIHLYNDGSYLIDDAGNAVLLYKFKTAKNGDRVIVVAKLDIFNNCPQGASGSVVLVKTISEGNANPLTPTPMTIAEIHAVDYNANPYWSTYISVTGVVVKDGTYYNLQDGAEIISLYQSNTTVLATLVGQKVTLKMWFYGISKLDPAGIWRMVFTGNEGEYALAEMTDAEKVAAAAAALPITANQELTDNVTLPATGDYGVSIVWSSDNAALLDAATGVVTRGETDATVTLTAVLTLNAETLTVTRTVTIKALPPLVPLTVSEFLALADGAEATVQGYIYRYDDGSYLIGEDGKAVLVYKFKAANHGDLVVVSGVKDIYNGTQQLASGAVLEKTISSGNTFPLNPTVMTGTEIYAIDYTTTTLFGTYISLTGEVIPDGSFYAIQADGLKISTYYSNNKVLGALVGKTVTVNAFLYGVGLTSGNVTARRIVFAGYDGEYPALTPAEKIAWAQTKVTLTEGQEVTANLTLLATADFGVTVTWTSDNAAIDAITGAVTRPANGAGDVTVKLTATFAVDEVTESVDYNVVVKEQAPVGTDIIVYSTTFDETGSPSKTSYAAADVALNGQTWNLSEVLIGNSASDAKNGTASLRFRADAAKDVSASMKWDVAGGLSKVSFSAAYYGTDVSNQKVIVYYSTDGGTTWTIAQEVVINATLTEYSVNINTTSATRVKFVVTADAATKRANLDDVKLYQPVI